VPIKDSFRIETQLVYEAALNRFEKKPVTPIIKSLIFCIKSRLLLLSGDSVYSKTEFASEGFEITDFANLDFTSTTKQLLIPLRTKQGVTASI
jgi:hypothetical protein